MRTRGSSTHHRDDDKISCEALKRGISYVAVVASGKPAITSYQTKEEFGAVTLLDVSLETGRTHHIRVHMAAIGHPLIGDQIYNKKSSAILQRQFLHAHTLGFHLPNSGNFTTFCSSLPHDLNLVYEGLLQEREQ